MIGSLRGEVLERDTTPDKGTGEVLVEVGGVGYRVTVTSAALAALTVGSSPFLYTHHHFWEADQRLFGFLTRAERDAFEGLLGAHKVGPALALAIIATHPPARLAMILATDDLDALCEVPGVGKKTAQRLLVDLKSTLVLPVLDTADGEPIDLTAGAVADHSALADVREALASLGYTADEIKIALSSLPNDPDLDSGALLKQALRSLAGG